LLAKANSSTEAPSTLRLEEPAEQRLTLLLIGFGSVVNEVATHLEPHRLCGHLFAVASALSVFYENCPVLKAEEPSRSSRLALCRVTRDVLATGLDLLGIDAPARM
jgi:arginyl-tRNA synthetase